MRNISVIIYIKNIYLLKLSVDAQPRKDKLRAQYAELKKKTDNLKKYIEAL
jgi:hypothetical protein